MPDSLISRPIDILTFVAAGNAIFTMTGSRLRFTYHVEESKRDAKTDRSVFFVSVLTGPSNTSDYSYLGIIPAMNGHPTAEFKLTKKSTATADANSVKAFAWFWRALTTKNEEHLALIKFQHEGRCGRCNRPLTVPESIERGIGPECAQIMRAA